MTGVGGCGAERPLWGGDQTRGILVKSRVSEMCGGGLSTLVFLAVAYLIAKGLVGVVFLLSQGRD